MSYTDAQMMIASQIAYLDFDRSFVDAGSYTVMELLRLMKESGDPNQAGKAETLISKIENTPSGMECADWIIKDIRNDQHTTGMYACMIDTRDGGAVIAYRGSESDTLENVVKDWGLSDMGLLNSILTPQQASAEKYMHDIYQEYGDKYEKFGVTGHSLGGNLAEHAVITASDDMREKIDQCVNLDGPGFSNVYLNAHIDGIMKSKGKIRHYQWSLVGGLLTPVPLCVYRTVQADTPEKENEIISMLQRHDTANMNFDNEGNVVSGERDWLTVVMSPLAKVLDLSLFSISYGFGTLPIYNSADNTRNIIRDLWDEWENKRFLQKKSMWVKMFPHIVQNELENISCINSRISELYDAAESICNQLKTDGICMSHAEIQLWSSLNHIERTMIKMEKYCDVGKECVQYYGMTDSKLQRNVISIMSVEEY